jgi:hypothetical protein
MMNSTHEPASNPTGRSGTAEWKLFITGLDMKRRKLLIILSVVAALAVVVGFAGPYISHYMLTGRFVPVNKIETLKNPIAVRGWSAGGLNLADGRTVPLPGLRALPGQSAALAEATKRGVEVDRDGRVWALVRVHHWCGNDSVRKHVARVDLSEMMTYLRVGEPTVTPPEAEFLATKSDGAFSEWGWRVGEFYAFESWQKLKNSAR